MKHDNDTRLWILLGLGGCIISAWALVYMLVCMVRVILAGVPW